MSEPIQLGTHQSTIIQLALAAFAEANKDSPVSAWAKESETALELRELLREASLSKTPLIMAETRY